MNEPVPTFTLTRFAHGLDSTLGVLHHGSRALCFVLEDEARAVKVAGETRIPEGIYLLRLRTWGGFHERYSRRYLGLPHAGMVELANVPGFTDILVHTGNTDDDTAGCLLLGDIGVCVPGMNEFRLAAGSSDSAYRRVYPILAGEIQERSTWLAVRSIGVPPVDATRVA